MMYLQRVQDAKRSYGTLLFCDSIYRGLNPNSIIGYNDEYLEEGLKEIYSAHKNVSPASVSFLEMDAYGVKVLLDLS